MRMGQRERERESFSRLLTEGGAQCGGAQSHNPEIMTWAEIKSRLLNQLSHPSTFQVTTWLWSLAMVDRY